MTTEIWAHRGSSHSQAENTMAAFEQAINDKADGIELDVQRSRDGKLVVYHDENLKRLTTKDAFLASLDWNDLCDLNIVADKEDMTVHHMPLLADVLELVQGRSVRVNIELKNSNIPYPGLEEEVLELAKRMNVMDQICFSSFNHMSMAYLAGKGYGSITGILYSDILYEPWKYAVNLGVGALHPMFNSLLQPDFVKNSHDAGLKVNMWTMDETVLINAALLLGVDAIITNVPQRALELKAKYLSDNGMSAAENLKQSGLLNLIG